MERFESVSKILYLRIASEELGLPEGSSPFAKSPNETDRSIYELALSAWLKLPGAYASRAARDSFPSDVRGTAAAIKLLRGQALSSDILGTAYESLLRNTFEKNDNQQYFTPRTVVEFMVSMIDLSDVLSVFDPACGSGGFLVAAAKMAKSLGNEDMRVCGIDVDERMSWLARANLAAHGVCTSDIECVNGAGTLGDLEYLENGLPEGGADVIFENPPFGSDMNDREVLDTFETGKGKASRRRSILFVERSLELLAYDGIMSVVLDDSVLNLPGNGDIREYMRRSAAILAVISLPDVTFMPYSTAKSSIVVLKKGAKQGDVFMAIPAQIGRRPNGEPLFDEAGSIASDLPEIIDQWNRWNRGEDIEGSICFTARLEDDLASRLDANYYHPSRKHSELALQNSAWTTSRLVDLFTFVADTVSLSSALEPNEQVTWVGLADVESSTGFYNPKTVRAGSIRSSVHRYFAGDLLFSRLRPELRKAFVAKEDGYCSSELLVMRPIDAGAILPEYAAEVLRSDLVFGQIVYKVTGIGRPRIGTKALKSVVLPVPPIDEQAQIVEDYKAALSKYQQACRRAEDEKRNALAALMESQEPTIG